MKFVVIVNQKYLVTVEANTHGGAEHKILDNVYHGVKTCQAFTLAEMSTDTFKALAENCETISYDELFKKAEQYKATFDNMENERNLLIECTREIENLYEKIKMLKDKSNKLTDNIITYKQELKEIW